MSETIIDNDFSNNYSSLPSEIKFFLGTEISGSIIIELANKYKIKEDKVYSLVFLTINSDFDLLLIKKRVLSLDLTGISLDKFWLDFLGSFLLPISEAIKEYTNSKVNIPEEIRKIGGNSKNYQKYIDSFNKEIEEKSEESSRNFIEEYKNDFDIKEESDYIFDLLSTDVIAMLTTDSFKASSSLNLGIIYLLTEDETFKDKALRKLFVNNEILGMESILIDNKKVEPTISNWLKDFIKRNGSDNFNDLLLIDYINNSTNAKNLSSNNKNILANLLRFYRNLSFFPDSLKNIDASRWKIFPFSDQENEEEKQSNLNEGRRIIKNSDILQEESSPREAEVLVEREGEEILALRRLLNSYAPSSLERKAINEEIRKIKKQEVR